MKKDINKRIFSVEYQERIFKKLEKYLEKTFSSDKKIDKILITGSLLKRELGKYEKYLGEKYDRIYSDIDLVFMVKDGFKVRKQWKLLAERPYFRVYRLSYIENKIPVEAVIVNKKFMKNKKAITLCENKGIPMKLEKSKNKYKEFMLKKQVKKVLCVCAKGLNRSKYLASYLQNKGYKTRFGGVEGFTAKEEAPNPISQEDVNWADVVIITRKRLKQIFLRRFKYHKKKIIILDVTDSKRLLPKEYAYLKDKSDREFDRLWRRPQLRKAIKKFFPL